MISQIYRFLNPTFQNLFLEYKVDFKPRYGHGKPPHKQLYDMIDAGRLKYSQLLQEALNYKDVFHSIKKMDEETDALKPAYNNGYLPGLDIIMLYTLIASYKPKTYFEIGSGNSTKIAYKAIKETGLPAKITSIDPKPRAEIDQLADTIVREPFESVNFETIFSLKENDILFIDNSHRILPNSDSMVFYLEVLPRLSKGVLVHIHDIYLPYDYPQFMCNRFYSEQYGLAMYLLANSEKYKPLLPNYFISQDAELREILNPVWNHPNMVGIERHGGSFWLTIQ
jgi:predicted O-methyltransferase YrrM